MLTHSCLLRFILTTVRWVNISRLLGKFAIHFWYNAKPLLYIFFNAFLIYLPLDCSKKHLLLLFYFSFHLYSPRLFFSQSWPLSDDIMLHISGMSGIYESALKGRGCMLAPSVSCYFSHNNITSVQSRPVEKWYWIT